MIKLIVVRHGETIENKLRIIQGQSEGYLSDYGKAQNKILGDELRKQKISKIYSSTLIRAVETAEEIIKHHPYTKLGTTPSLMEWNLGILQGEKYPDNLDFSSQWEGKEKPESVKKRLEIFLNEIEKHHSNENIILVSHGLTIKVMTTILKKMPLYKVYDLELMNNSSYKIFHIY